MVRVGRIKKNYIKLEFPFFIIFILVMLVALAASPCRVAAQSPPIAVIGTTEEDTNFTLWLRSLGYTVHLYDVASASSVTIVPGYFKVVIIESDTQDSTDSSTWSGDASVVNGWLSPILGLGRGGLTFFGDLSLKIGWLRGARNSSNPAWVEIVNPTHSIFSSWTAGVNNLTLYNGGITGVWEICVSVSGSSCQDSSGLTLLGRDASLPIAPEYYYPIIQQDRYFLWGFEPSFGSLTIDGQQLLGNLVAYIASIAPLPYYLDVDGDGHGDPTQSITLNLPTPPSGYAALAGDNCMNIYNPSQADGDTDGLGDACDSCPTTPHGSDADGDCVADATDNCPSTYNPDQADSDVTCTDPINFSTCSASPDGIGDACDNCPSVPGMSQADDDDDGLGNICDVRIEEVVEPPAPCTDDLPCLVTACFVNQTGNPLRMVEPDCYNTKFKVTRDPGGSTSVELVPLDEVGPLTQMPDDFITLLDDGDGIVEEGEQYCITCNIAEKFKEEDFTGSAGAGTPYRVQGVYVFLGKDPNVGSSGECETLDEVDPDGNPVLDPGTGLQITHQVNCYYPFRGEVWAAQQEVTVKKVTELPPFEVELSFREVVAWDAHWPDDGTLIWAYVTGVTLDTVNLSTVMLNGEVVASRMAEEGTNAIKIAFDRYKALKSLKTLTWARSRTVYIQGRQNSTESSCAFSGKCEVPIVPIADKPAVVVGFQMHSVGQRNGTSAPATKELLKSRTVRLYRRDGACTQQYLGAASSYLNVWCKCVPLLEKETDDAGTVIFTVSELIDAGITNTTELIAIGEYATGDIITPPAQVGECLLAQEVYYPWVNLGPVPMDGSVVQKDIKMIQYPTAEDASKVKKQTAKSWKFVQASEFTIVEPTEVLWSGEAELYPFVFDSIGDWMVTTTVSPPEGFVADYPSVSAEVNSEHEAVAVVIYDIGSDWVPTKVKYKIKHNGKEETIESAIGVRLTPELAKKKGVSVYGDVGKKKK